MVPKGYRYSTVAEQLERHIERIPFGGCWIWIGCLGDTGYGAVMIGGRPRKAHRISWETFRGPIGKLHVLHRCDIPCCINPDHLWLGTPLDNKRDAVSKGRHTTARGEKCHRAKLNEQQVREIKNLLASGKHSQIQIGRMFGVGKSAIGHISVGNTWGWL